MSDLVTPENTRHRHHRSPPVLQLRLAHPVKVRASEPRNAREAKGVKADVAGHGAVQLWSQRPSMTESDNTSRYFSLSEVGWGALGVSGTPGYQQPQVIVLVGRAVCCHIPGWSGRIRTGKTGGAYFRSPPRIAVA